MTYRFAVRWEILPLAALLAATSCAASEELMRQTGTGGDSGSAGDSGAAGDAGRAGSGTGGSGGSGQGGSGGSTTGGKGGTGATGGSGGSTGGSGGSTGGTGGATGGTGGATGGTGGATGGSTGTGPVIPATFFDDFEDGNITTPAWIDADATLGASWAVTTDGTNRVFTQSAAVSDWTMAVSGDYRWTNQVIEAKVKYTALGMIGVFARFLDTRNYYFLYLDGSNIILRKRVNNSSTNLVKIKTPAVVGTWYTLKLSVSGSTLVGYLDGTMLVSGTDSDLKSGGIAVGTSDSATGSFDDVRVTTP